MQGRRVPFRAGWPGDWSEPGDYCKVPPDVDPRGEHVWYALAPNGDAFALVSHDVAEAPDGTISVTPSIVTAGGWHGFLTGGVWTP